MYSGMTVNVLLERTLVVCILLARVVVVGTGRPRSDWIGRGAAGELGTRPVSLMNSNNNNNMHTKYAHTPTRSTISTISTTRVVIILRARS